MWLKYQVKFCGFNHFISFSKIEKCICLMLADLDQFSQFREFQIRYPKITDVSCLGSVPDLDLRVVNELLMWVEWEMFTTEFVWLLWNWWYFSIGWGCSSFGLMNWLNFFLIWCWCSQDLICPSFSLFSFGCFKCVFCFVFCFGFECSKYNKFVFQKQIRFSVFHWSMKREGTQKIHWSEKDSTQSFFNWWMKKSHNKSESNRCKLGKSERRSKGRLCACSLCLTFV